ncbi:MAG: U32 family peptidase [Candidatus Omnitrophota bacterium]
MIYFNTPADFDINKIDKYRDLNQKFSFKKFAVKSFYGNLNPSEFPSARYQSILPVINLRKLKEYVNVLHKTGFEFNYTFNAICLENIEHTKSGQRKIIDHIKILRDAGIDSITVSNFRVIDLIKKVAAGLKINISANLQIMSAGGIGMLRGLGIDSIVLSTDANKNFGIIADIVNNTKINVEIIINSGCMLGCPFSYSHYSYISHAKNLKLDANNLPYFELRCELNRILYPERSVFLSSFIRPEDISIYYNNLGITNFKLIGRHKTGRDYLKNLEVYMQEYYQGNFFELFYGLQDNILQDIFYLDNRRLDRFLENLYRNKIDYFYNYREYMDRVNTMVKHIKINKKLKKQRLQFCERQLKCLP